jgi:hypothetical protein
MNYTLFNNDYLGICLLLAFSLWFLLMHHHTLQVCLLSPLTITLVLTVFSLNLLALLIHPHLRTLSLFSFAYNYHSSLQLLFWSFNILSSLPNLSSSLLYDFLLALILLLRLTIVVYKITVFIS